MPQRKKLFAALLATAAIGTSHAAIVDHGDYLTDTATGLDWLDVTKSVNMSYNYVSSQFGTGGAFEGWRYATGNEFNGLIGAWTGISPSSFGSVSQQDNKIDGLVTLLGDTLATFWLDQYGVPFPSARNETHGIIADSQINMYHWTALIDDYDVAIDAPDSTIAHYSQYAGDQHDYFTGSYLVRSTTQTVPEPTTIVLMGMGLAGFGLSRRKKKPQQTAKQAPQRLT